MGKLDMLSGESPINRIPPEVWEMVTENVCSSKDLINLAEAIPNCAQVIYSKRVEWLFYQVVPLLVTNLFGTFKIPYRGELLNCRLVCKHWKFGVDNFYENNALHYPASGDNVDWKLERCHYAETFYFNRDGILGRELKIEKLHKIMNEAANHSNNPFVGKHLNIFVPAENNGVKLVERFFVLFGRHIHYLRLHLNVYSSPLSDLQMLIRILPHLSNLKGLAFDKYNFIEHENVSKRSLNYMKRELSKVQKKILLTDSFRNKLPKIEMLHLNISDVCGDILSEMIFNMFPLEQLKSLIILEYCLPAQVTIKTSNLLYLRMEIEKNEQLETILALDCPLVRKLELDVTYKELNYDILCKVLQKFQDRLSHLTLHLPEPVEKLDTNIKEFEQMTDFFTNSDKLKMPNIKTLTLIGECPISFNFICGDGFKSLEYLHLYLDNRDQNGSEVSFSSSTATSKNVPLLKSLKSEKTDLIEKLATIWPDDPWLVEEPDMYNSNVWSIFPRLKCIHVARHGDWEPLCRNGWTYRKTHLQ